MLQQVGKLPSKNERFLGPWLGLILQGFDLRISLTKDS